jgi:hypothetical protein
MLRCFQNLVAFPKRGASGPFCGLPNPSSDPMMDGYEPMTAQSSLCVNVEAQWEDAFSTWTSAVTMELARGPRFQEGAQLREGTQDAATQSSSWLQFQR